MKKLSTIMGLSFLITLFTIAAIPKKAEAQGFNYETTQTVTWNSISKFCIVATCTRTHGSDCTMPGSKTRVCIDTQILF